MELKLGYKQTVIGVIPEDWDTLPLGKVAIVERGKFSARPRNDPKFFGGDIPFIQTGDVTNSDGRIRYFSQALNIQGLAVSKLFPVNTLFFTIAANIGDVGICTFATACPDSLVAITPTSKIDKEWIFHSLRRQKKKFEALATHNAQLNINLEKLNPFVLAVPPLPEQRAIAAVLSDTDALLISLARLLAKKRDIKQAVMQQLLTGKQRLPGFCGEWMSEQLGKLVSITKGQQLNRAELSSTGFPAWNGGIEPSGYTDVWNTSENTITISEGGNSCGFVGFVNQKFWCGGHCYALLNVSATLDKVFLYYLLKSQQQVIMGLRMGSGLPNIQRKYLSELLLLYPSIPEQTAIAAVLSDMDAEIDAMKERWDKTRAVKQGMMQELLTGRTRLVGASQV